MENTAAAATATAATATPAAAVGGAWDACNRSGTACTGTGRLWPEPMAERILHEHYLGEDVYGMPPLALTHRISDASGTGVMMQNYMTTESV